MILHGIRHAKSVLALSASLLLICPVAAEDGAVPPLPEQKPAQADSKPEAAASGTTTGAEPKPAAAAPTAGAESHSQAKPGEPAANEPTQKEHKVAPEPLGKEEALREPALPARAAAGRPIKLYGRIEELCAGKGAKIPLKMQALTPLRDTSLDAKLAASATTLAGKASTLAAKAAALQVYPMDYRGSWSGQVTVNSANFDPAYFEMDAAEARKESELLRPGIKGSYSVTFYQGNNNRIQMQPSQVVFQGSDTMGNQMKLLGKSDPRLKGMMGANNPLMANMQIPIMFALHMGTPILAGEIGVTGNQMSSELMKSSLKEVAKGVLESQFVTRERERDPETGKTKDGFSESVLRFTRLNNQQLYLQAAYVYYRKDGHFLAKYILYGTLERGNGQPAAYPSPMANPFGLPGMGNQANPFGQMAPGGKPADLIQQMNQMQNMIKKMSGQ
jgi:hypothetical protein